MAKSKIPQSLPQCDLVQILAGKADLRHDIDFNFLGRLDDFRQRVSGEVRQINQLFPEYTPHDEEYHLKRLFHVACTILGRNCLEEMNSAELFVLAVALYGHDWGMAVSEPEKQYIVTGVLPEGIRVDDLWILHDEPERFAKFARKQQLAVDAKGHLKDISIELWREYVRQTHAVRSGERVRRFFEPIDRGIAEAAARVCEGHWLDFERLQEYKLYPPDFSVLRESTNIRALAVYLRLADLFDLAEDRTPYVIWKFVAPRDPRSRMEWAKHRALQPVTCPTYQAGRIVRVDGSTDDHEVFAALEDLRIWCEEQLHGCNDLLAQMNDPRHQLDLYHLDWRVGARGFKPVSIQFEFDRERMFEILGDEIYQGDPYVFLRELLQNSIDAIRMRREILQRNRVSPGDLGVIRVTVEHFDGGDAVVTWQDDGIGMDEYVVRNYFAIAGRSYYRSPDFEREGLKMDPISRFGIGTLSCFMVAECVEIETFKDPYLPPSGEPLKIMIPAMRRQFRIEVRPRETAKVGTTFRVSVLGKKLPTDDESEAPKPLDVTGYLSVVAGFVEFPIAVIEGERKTIILHPRQDAEAARKHFGEEFQVHQLDLTYPWSEAILPQDLPIAKRVLREVRYDLSDLSDLGMEGYDGVLTYLIPHDRLDCVSASRNAAHIRSLGQAEQVDEKVRIADGWLDSSEGEEHIGISRSSRHLSTYAVYRDGILLATASSPLLGGSGYYYGEVSLPLPYLVANLPKSRALKVDLARTQLVRESEHWSLPVFRAHLRHLFSETSLRELLALDPSQRLYQLGRIIMLHRIRPGSLWEAFPHERWPLLFLESGGRFNVVEWQEVAAGPVVLLPLVCRGEVTKAANCQWLEEIEYKGPLLQWGGERSIAFSSGGVWSSETVDYMMNLWRVPVTRSHRLAAVRFLRPPWEGDPPLYQRIWLPMQVPEQLPPIEALLSKAIEDPGALDPAEEDLLDDELRGKVGYGRPQIVEFQQPFEHCFAYGTEMLNRKHPVALALLRMEAALALSKWRGILSPKHFGQMQDALNATLLFRRFFSSTDWERFADTLRSVWSLAREMRLLDVSDVEALVPAPEEFVPGTFGKPVTRTEEQLDNLKSVRPFGQPLA